ncbi:hypothetical protein [Chenggangzhangella methanolivorans]|uniref:Uncharacterized protein n=1 Tax=Chenggangzhangella methanolivorans TaxID=1437009 RepID=A0A9E6RBK8_9HYPH|nr:hypothetical protein [Chenggangzhangella methanolivorans]QZO01778.1 hypothetical protein K6K41_10670 [Chenggangzhangella methanolivorans]
MGQRWFEAASKAEPKVKDAARGMRERAIKEEARVHNISSQTLTRAILALNFAREFQDRHQVDLTKMALNTVEDIKKWASYDVAGAKAVAERVVTDKLSVRAVRSLEQKARDPQSIDLPDRLAPSVTTELLVEDINQKYPDDRYIRIVPSEDAPSADYCLYDDQTKNKIFIRVFSDYSRDEVTRRKLVNELVLALAIRDYFGSVVIYVESQSTYRIANEWLLYRHRSYDVRVPPIRQISIEMQPCISTTKSL